MVSNDNETYLGFDLSTQKVKFKFDFKKEFLLPYRKCLNPRGDDNKVWIRVSHTFLVPIKIYYI